MGFFEDKWGVAALLLVFVVGVVALATRAVNVQAPVVDVIGIVGEVQKWFLILLGLAIIAYTIWKHYTVPDVSQLAEGEDIAAMETSLGAGEREAFKTLGEYTYDFLGGGVLVIEAMTMNSTRFYHFLLKSSALASSTRPLTLLVGIDPKRVPSPQGAGRLKCFGNKTALLEATHSRNLFELNHSLNGMARFDPRRELWQAIKRGDVDEEFIQHMTAGAGIEKTGVNIGGKM